MSKHLLIVGASAGVGRLTVLEALMRGHKVSAVARNLASLPDFPAVEKIQGSATDAEVLASVLYRVDAVIVTLGTGKSMKPTTLYSDFANTLLALHAQRAVTAPVLVLTGFGAGDSRPYLGFVMKYFFNWFLNKVYVDKTLLEDRVAASSLQWELVRPGLLTNRPFTGRCKVQTQLHSGMEVGAISRSAVANFLVNEAESPRYLRQKPALQGKALPLTERGCGFVPSLMQAMGEYDLVALKDGKLFFGDRSGDLNKARPEMLTPYPLTRQHGFKP